MRLQRLMGALDDWQRGTRWASVSYAVVRKFGDDNANLLVVALAWYGFTAIFPLLLMVVSVFGFVGAGSLGSDIVTTLHKFPVIGTSFNPANSSALRGSVPGLIIGLGGLLYGVRGVAQTAQQALVTVWNIPQVQRIGFLPRLGRSFLGLVIIGGTFVTNAVITAYATGWTSSFGLRAPIIAALLPVNAGLYFLTFDVLTGKAIRPHRQLVPGAILGAVAFTLLITVGAGLMTHQLRHASATYGAFGSVIGIVTFLLLLTKLSLYAAELNPVLARHLYPRALPLGRDPTSADKRVLAALVDQEQRSQGEAISVGFGPDAADQPAAAGTRERVPDTPTLTTDKPEIGDPLCDSATRDAAADGAQ